MTLSIAQILRRSRSLPTVFLAGYYSLAAGCGLVKAGKTCNLTAQGLKAEAITGSELGDKQLSLMFLQGPAAVSADLGTFLEQRSIQGSFFVKGQSVPEYQATLKNLREQGHLIGNGGYTFTSLLETKNPELEIRSTDKLIRPFVTGNIFLLHAPDAKFDQRLAALLNRQGLGKYRGPIQADTVASGSFMDDAACWENELSTQSCAQQYFTEITRLRRGVVAFHDQDSRSIELLAILVPQLQAFGFEFVRLDKLPSLRADLLEQGSSLDQVAGDPACDDYR